MPQQRLPKPRTDLGTIILHWLLVCTLAAALATGLGLAGAASNRDSMVDPDLMLSGSWLWRDHIRSAYMLIAVMVAYPIYMARARLGPRIRLDRVRLRGVRHQRYRWATVNVILNWICYLNLLAQLLTGAMLYFGRGGAAAAEIHWLGSWAIVAFVPLHVLAHVAFGGLHQLLRLFRPAPLTPRQPRFVTSRHPGHPHGQSRGVSPINRSGHGSQ